MSLLHTQVPKTKTPTFELVDLRIWDKSIPVCSILICDIVYFIGFGFQTLILSTHLLQLTGSNHNSRSEKSYTVEQLVDTVVTQQEGPWV